ncbi:hypothetical protein MC885_019419 [Smutsia gigantea]|nr:hypothetical protein MC885_019419 [Smutsia gigantea]
MFTEYCTSGEVIGELSCLLKWEIEYTAICETVLQACFISLEDLYEDFDVFWPSLEYKIWLKLAISSAYQYFESSLVDEVQGTSDISKLLVIQASKAGKNKNNSKFMVGNWIPF